MKTVIFVTALAVLFGSIIAVNVTMVVLAGDAEPVERARLDERPAVVEAPVAAEGAGVGTEGSRSEPWLALLGAVFVASLVGSVHCAGMCGGLVVLCVGVDGPHRTRSWINHVSYHGGRLATYAVLGAVSGTIGAAIDLGGAAFGLARPAAVVAGALMIACGAIALLQLRGWRPRCLRLPARLDAALRRGLALASDLPGPLRALTIGLLTGFLPCGWLYAFVVTAAGTGRAGLGALTMVVFWAGTVPILLIVGAGASALMAPLRRHVPTLTALAVVVIGVLTVAGRLTVPAYAGSERAEASIERVESLVDSPPACCDDDS